MPVIFFPSRIQANSQLGKLFFYAIQLSNVSCILMLMDFIPQKLYSPRIYIYNYIYIYIYMCNCQFTHPEHHTLSCHTGHHGGCYWLQDGPGRHDNAGQDKLAGHRRGDRGEEIGPNSRGPHGIGTHQPLDRRSQVWHRSPNRID